MPQSKSCGTRARVGTTRCQVHLEVIDREQAVRARPRSLRFISSFRFSQHFFAQVPSSGLLRSRPTRPSGLSSSRPVSPGSRVTLPVSIFGA
jgi:hypothetical protein